MEPPWSGRPVRRPLGIALALGLALAVTACGGRSDAPPTPVEEGFYGAAAGDEPNAVLAARDVLVAGGNATDAVVAYYFAAAVTYPAAVSLGAGGVCVVYSAEANKAEALEFLSPLAPARQDDRRPVAVPALPRGLYALHSRYGRLRFGQLVAPAEALARFGHRVSRSLASDIALAGPALLAEPDLAALLGGKGEGADLIQLDLAATLTQIRTGGVGEFYTGGLGRRLVEGARAAGTDLDFDSLAAFAPTWRVTADLPVGFDLAHAAPPPATGGAAALAALAMIGATGGPPADGADRLHLTIEAGLRALAEREAWQAGDGAAALDTERLDRLMAGFRADTATDPASLPNPPVAVRENPTAAGFAAADRFGNAVACAVTLNNLFGSARIAQGTGVLLGAARRVASPSLTPIIVANHNARELKFVGAASGGVAAPTVMAGVLAGVFQGGLGLADAVRQPRAVPLGEPNLVVPEPGVDAATREALARRGHGLTEPFGIGRVNAIHCVEGLRNRPDTCVAVTDGRGFGLAAGG
jgi:gamma-glutamyltranspeptidase/glutathione hydrolase